MFTVASTPSDAIDGYHIGSASRSNSHKTICLHDKIILNERENGCFICVSFPSSKLTYGFIFDEVSDDKLDKLV